MNLQELYDTIVQAKTYNFKDFGSIPVQIRVFSKGDKRVKVLKAEYVGLHISHSGCELVISNTNLGHPVRTPEKKVPQQLTLAFGKETK